MHSSRNKYDWFITSKFSYFLIVEGGSFAVLKTFSSFMRRDDKERNRSSFIAFGEFIMSEK